MISVGVDVSKEKSTICILKPFGEVLMPPRDFQHTKSDMKELLSNLKGYDDDIRITMEATGNYHLPIALRVYHSRVAYVLNNAE